MKKFGIIFLVLSLCSFGGVGYFFWTSSNIHQDVIQEIKSYNGGSVENLKYFEIDILDFLLSIKYEDTPTYGLVFFEKIVDISRALRVQGRLERNVFSEVTFRAARNCLTFTADYEPCVGKGLENIRKFGDVKFSLALLMGREGYGLLEIIEAKEHPFKVEMNGWRGCLSYGSRVCLESYVKRYKDRTSDDYITLMLALTYFALDKNLSRVIPLVNTGGDVTYYQYYLLALAYRYQYDAVNCLKYSNAAIKLLSKAKTKNSRKYNVLFNHSICLRRANKVTEAAEYLSQARALVDLDYKKNSLNYMRFYIENFLQASLLKSAWSAPQFKDDFRYYLNNFEFYLYIRVFENVLNSKKSKLPELIFGPESLSAVYIKNLERDMKSLD